MRNDRKATNCAWSAYVTSSACVIKVQLSFGTATKKLERSRNTKNRGVPREWGGVLEVLKHPLIFWGIFRVTQMPLLTNLLVDTLDALRCLTFWGTKQCGLHNAVCDVWHDMRSNTKLIALTTNKVKVFKAFPGETSWTTMIMWGDALFILWVSSSASLPCCNFWVRPWRSIRTFVIHDSIIEGLRLMNGHRKIAQQLIVKELTAFFV